MARQDLQPRSELGSGRSLAEAHAGPPGTLTASLLRAVSAEQVAEVVLREGCLVLEATCGLLHRLLPEEAHLSLAGTRGVDLPLPRELAAPDLSADLPFTEAVRTGRPVCLGSRRALAARFPALAAAGVLPDAEGWLVLPLGTGEHRQGAVTFGLGAGSGFGAEARLRAAALVEQCALALERVRLYEAEQQARRAAERLQVLTAALSEAATQAAVGGVLMREGVAALGAYAGVMALEVADGRELELAASIGYPEEACMSAGRRWPIQARIPIAEAIRTGEPVFLESPEAWAEHFGTALRSSGISAAWAAIPLRLRSGGRGALLWTFAEPRRFCRTERELMTAVARQGAQALERAWLFEAERRARGEAERAVERTGRLQALTAALAGALTPDQVARAVVEHGTAALGADAGVVALAGPGGRTLTVADSLGYDPEMLEGWRSFPHDAEVPLAEAFRTGEPVVLLSPEERDARYPALGGGVTEHASSASVPLLVDGEAVGAMGLVFRRPMRLDAGDREFMLALGRLCAQAVRRAALYAQVAEANRAKADFLATMSHELRTPLTAVIGYQELLAEGITGPVTEAQRTQLHRIKVSAMHLLALIDEVLTFARIEARMEEARLEEVEVGEALSRAADLVSPMAAERGLTLEVRPPEGPVALVTDRGKLQQVLVNLLSNAVKFTDEGRVELSACPEEAAVRFEVSDTGIGIAEPDLARIFEPFTQVDSATTRRFGGTGLGLSVCQKLVRLLGGEIAVRSTPGRGSTFSVRIPR